MRYLATLTFIFALSLSARAQEKIYEQVDEKPVFNGGLKDYLIENQYYPQPALDSGLEGRVIVKFVVEKDGQVSSPEIVRSSNKIFNDETIRLVNTMPLWQPATIKRKPVRTFFVLGVDFEIPDTNKIVIDQYAEPTFDINEYLVKNFGYPKEAAILKIEGTVVVACVIDETGSLKGIRVKKGVHPALDKEAIRLVSHMPAFKPATAQGKPVSIAYEIPIRFSLDNGVPMFLKSVSK